MNKIEIGNVVTVRAISNLHIVVTHIDKEKFQGVYFSDVSQEFKFTPMMPITLAEKIEE